MELRHLIGDATEPVLKPAIICHVCNTIGAWGSGFVIPLGKKYPEAKAKYLKLKPALTLKQTQIINFNNEVSIANMIAQEGIYKAKDGTPPIRYEALEKCLEDVQSVAIGKKATVHMPRIGAKLAGGDWDIIEEIIKKTMRVDTYVYTLLQEKDDWKDTEYYEFPEPSGSSDKVSNPYT